MCYIGPRYNGTSLYASENKNCIGPGSCLFKGLITVWRELRQQHPRDLLSGWDVPRAALSGRPSAVINPDYSMTKQHYITCIYDKIHSKSPLNRATSPICLHCDVTHHSLTTGVVTLHIPSRRLGVREENRRHIKLCGQLMQVEWFVALKMIYVESSITVNISECFCNV